jgi:pimeloyl-ACP methyl ester carboxylesterase
LKIEGFTSPCDDPWHHLATPTHAEEQSVRDANPYDVKRIMAPVVYGQGGDIVMPMVVDHLAANIPRFERVTLPGATHHAHRSHPDEFARLIRRALAMAR